MLSFFSVESWHTLSINDIFLLISLFEKLNILLTVKLKQTNKQTKQNKTTTTKNVYFNHIDKSWPILLNLSSPLNTYEYDLVFV